VNILVLADFRRDHTRGLFHNNPRKFAKGFLRNGHNVLEFSYREMLLSASPIRSKRWAARLAKKRTDALLAALARDFQPGLIMVCTYRLLDGATLERLRHAAPQAGLVFWYGDLRAGLEQQVTSLAPFADWLVATSAGEVLQRYHAAGFRRCAFLPNPCDPDCEAPHAVEQRWRSRLVFTGALEHALPGEDPERPRLIRHLVEHRGLTVWGCLGRPGVYGRDYLDALAGADIALSINVFNHVPLYHSSRLTHCLGCGTFTLAKYVPQSERLFEHEKHLVYFGTLEECVELADRYLADEPARRRIAAAGRGRLLEQCHLQKLAGFVVDLLRDGGFQAPWAEFVT